MATVGVADATVSQGGRKAYERPALIAGVLGLVAVVALVFIQPDTRATNLSVEEIEAAAPEAFGSDGGVAAPAAPISAPTLGLYPAAATLRLEGSRSGGSTSTDREVQVQVRAVEEAPTDGTYIMVSAGIVAGRNIIAYKEDGAYIVARDALGENGCEFDTPIKRWASPMEVGASWTSSGTCTQRAPRGDFTRTAEVTVESRITGTKKVTVGSATLDTFVVETTIRTVERIKTADNEALSNQVQRENQLFAPALGLAVQQSTNTVTINKSGTEEGKQEVTTTLKLLSTQPGGAL